MAGTISRVRTGSGVKLESRIPAIIDELPDRSLVLSKAVCHETVLGGKAKVPVRTGTLQRSLDTTVVDRQGDTVGAGVTAAWYWFFVEFGTVKQGPQPYLIPSHDAAVAMLPSLAETSFRYL